jgi:hypothetical protein
MSGRQAALPTEGTGTRITLICTSRTIAATRRDLRQIGGYRMSRDCLVVTVCNQMPDPVADDE